MIHTIKEEAFIQKIATCSKLIIIEVGAQWSGACSIMEPIVDQLALQFCHKIIVCRFDVEGCEHICSEYRIKKLPTYLIFKNGELVDHISGVVSKGSFLNKIYALVN